MPDIVDPETRSRMMAGIRGRNTKPEITIRKALHARGFRYRLHVSGVPGNPDIVFPRRSAVALIHGCFWHGHDCPLFRLPGTRAEFWRTKIERNRQRDQEVASSLKQAGWRRLTIWECALRGKGRLDFPSLIDRADAWLRDTAPTLEIRGAV